jgi:hypothetical protein
VARTITFTLDDQTYAAGVAALCANYGYRAEVPDPTDPGKTLPNPVSPDQFATAQVQAFVAENIRAHLVRRAAEMARQQAGAAVDAALSQAEVTAEVT